MLKSKIIPRILGGLGNQLFIYAAARRLSLINNAELVLDNISGFKYDTIYKQQYQLKHFNIPSRIANSNELMIPFSRIRRLIKRNYNKLKKFENRSYISQNKTFFDYRILDLKFSKTLYLEGYWQSEDYFKDIENDLRKDLEIITPLNQANKLLGEKIRSVNSVAVHIRFFSNPNEILLAKNNDFFLSDYYKLAISIMESKVKTAHYFVFSNFPNFARSFISLPDNRITIVNINRDEDLAFADLWLMSQCSNFIIANSTFSWWGAWLSNNSSKIIIAPDFKRFDANNFWHSERLVPSNWTLI